MSRETDVVSQLSTLETITPTKKRINRVDTGPQSIYIDPNHDVVYYLYIVTDTPALTSYRPGTAGLKAPPYVPDSSLLSFLGILFDRRDILNSNVLYFQATLEALVASERST